MLLADELGFLRPDVVIEPLVNDRPSWRGVVRLALGTANRDMEPVELRVPFWHPGLAELALARIRPTSAARLREAFGLDDEYHAPLAVLLCEEPSFAADRHVTSGGRVRFFGRGCVVVQGPRGAVVCNPSFGGKDAGDSRYTIDDLPDFIDMVLITDRRPLGPALESLLHLRGRIARVVVPPSASIGPDGRSLTSFLARLGLPVTEVGEHDEVRFPGGTVTGTWAGFRVRVADAGFFLGFPVSLATAGVLSPARTEGCRIDMVFLPTGRAGLGADASVAARAIVSTLEAEEAYLCGDEAQPAAQDPDREFLSWCSERGIVAARLSGGREWCW